MSRRIILLGHPLGHSISPAFQQAALDFYRLDMRYEPWDRGPSQLGAAIEELRSPAFAGANVTIPHKEAALALLDSYDERCRDIGAVNTVICTDGHLAGRNTDVDGFIDSLRLDGKFEPRGKTVLLLGAGGAARAVAYALVKSAVASLLVANRTDERAGRLVADMSRIAAAERAKVRLGALSWKERGVPRVLAGCDLIINCTSMGMKHSPQASESPLNGASLPSGAFVYDLVYNPRETPLLADARQSGAAVQGGLAMLVRQGARAFELWTRRDAPVAVMFAAASRALGE